jgi:hypothetical protein
MCAEFCEMYWFQDFFQGFDKAVMLYIANMITTDKPPVMTHNRRLLLFYCKIIQIKILITLQGVQFFGNINFRDQSIFN